MKLIGITLAKSCIENHYPVLMNIDHHLPLYDRLVIGVPRRQSDGTTREIRAWMKNLTKKDKSKVKIVKIPWNDNSPVAWAYPDQYEEVLRQVIEESEAEAGDWFVKLDADEFFHENDFLDIRALCAHANALHSLPQAPNAKKHSYSTIRTGFIHFTGSLRTHQGWHRTCQNGVMKVFRQGTSVLAGDGANYIPLGWSDVLSARHIYLYHTGYCQPEPLLRKRFEEHLVNIRKVDPHATLQEFDWGQYKLANFPRHRLPEVLQRNFDYFDIKGLEPFDSSYGPYFR